MTADTPRPISQTNEEQLAELRALLEQLDTRDLAFVVAYVTDLASGRLVPDGAGSVRVTRRLEPLTEDQSPYAGLFNSVLGLSPKGE